MTDPDLEPKRKTDLAIALGGASVVLVQVLGWIFPGLFWASNYLAYLPTPWALLMLLLSAGLVLWSVVRGNRIAVPTWLVLPAPSLQIGVVIGLALAFGVGCYQLPIADDNYGNAGTYQEMRDQLVAHAPAGGWSELLQADFSPGQGRRTVFRFVSLLAYQGGTTLGQGYRLLGAVCGGLYALVWLLFLRGYVRGISTRIILGLAALSAPLVQLFCGHLESYAPVLLVLTTWLALAVIQLRDRKSWQLWSLLPLWLLGLRLSALFLLLLPPLAMLYLRQFAGERAWAKALFTLRGLVLRGMLPLGILGLGAYFFIFGDHIDPRSLDNFRDIDRLFLPLFSPVPPLERYNLFSPAHLFDFFQVMLSASPVLLLLFFSSKGKWKNASTWEHPTVVWLTGVVSLLGAMLFMMNPLFSMPMDWDLFCLLSIPLLFLAAVISQATRPLFPIRKLLPAALGCAVLVVPMLVVNAAKKPHAQRLMDLSGYIYQTYYCHADKYFLYGLLASDPDPVTYLEKQKVALQEWEPHAYPGKDEKYANLWLDHALTQLALKKDVYEAIAAFSKSDEYAPLSPEHRTTLMELYFRTRSYTAAYECALQLKDIPYPSEKKSLQVVLHIALEMGLYDDAAAACRYLLALEPDDTFIQQIQKRLQEGDAVEELKLLFQQK